MIKTNKYLQQLITETEQRIADLKQQIEKARDIDERMRKLRERRTGGRTSADDGTDAGRTGQKDETIMELNRQLSRSLTLNEKLNSENRAENIEALRTILRQTEQQS